MIRVGGWSVMDCPCPSCRPQRRPPRTLRRRARTCHRSRPSHYGPPMEPTSPAEPVAYAWPLSVAPGEPVALYAAGPPVQARVVVARIGAHREVVWSGSVDVEPHPVPERAAADGCGWPIALEIPTAPDWRSGYYELALVSDAGRVAHEAVAFFVVRSATPDPDRPLL